MLTGYNEDEGEEPTDEQDLRALPQDDSAGVLFLLANSLSLVSTQKNQDIDELDPSAVGKDIYEAVLSPAILDGQVEGTQKRS